MNRMDSISFRNNALIRFLLPVFFVIGLSIPFSRAQNKDFNMDPAPESVRLTVAPPFWRHPAFLFLSSLLLLSVGAGIALVLKRDAKLREVNASLEISKKELNQANLDLQELKVKLERSNENLEQFACVASHDLQEPLRMVTSYMALLERRIQNKLDQDSKEFMQFAVDGSSRMQQLINDLLSYSRVTTKGKPFEPTNSEEVFGTVLKNLEAAINESGAKVSHDPLPVVTADGGQITRLFQNLVGNAIQYRDSQKAPEVHVSAQKKGAEWVFSVRDNGIGIDPQYHDRIFGIFQRLHTREQYPGTGIGLAVCKKIVERHGGEIRVESEVGKGSTFYFSLPDSNESTD